MIEESMNIEDIKNIIFPVFAAGYEAAYYGEDDDVRKEGLAEAYNKWFNNLVKDAGVYPTDHRRYYL